MRTDSTQELLTVAEVAARLQLTRGQIYRAIASGELRALTLGERGTYRIPAPAVDTFLRPVSSRAMSRDA